MPINPSKSGSALNNPTQRANELNDPQFADQQGYFPYDLTHGEFITPRFGEVTPSMCVHTIPGDRMVCRDNTKTILNQINGNLLSTVNQYVDTFFVPLRCLYPTNYAKLIPNPTKGDDLPNSALPQFPLFWFINDFLNNAERVTLSVVDIETTYTNSNSVFMRSRTETSPVILSYRLSKLTLLATMLSRGQLLDYLGCQFDGTDSYTRIQRLQTVIDEFFDAFWNSVSSNNITTAYVGKLSPTTTQWFVNTDVSGYDISTKSKWRDFISHCFEKGYFFYLPEIGGEDLTTAISKFLDFVDEYLYGSPDAAINHTVSEVDNVTDPFRIGFISLMPCLAYQQVIAQYYTNNTVDNIFTGELFMELLRSIMFPSNGDGVSVEPTFTYNGVNVEYDYMTTGAALYGLMGYNSSKPAGMNARQYLFITIMFLMRRSLRYGDYFSTARPNMLAVGDLSINVSGGAVSPIDVTKNLLMQRYLNAANYIGSGELPYFASIFGVTPSDTGSYPRFISHRKIELKNDVNTNLGDNQGYQMTNLVGYTDDSAFDVFIDDFGIIMSLQSYDVLPVYDTGLDPTFHFSDRFDMFNPMLQNIGDQPILLSEMIGDLSLRNSIFGYTMRNGEYKFKNSRAHGGFSSSLPGFLVKFNLDTYIDETDGDFVISPDFIRDKPIYLDGVVTSATGTSPATYYHFVVSCLNQLQTSRRMQATPPVLF